MERGFKMEDYTGLAIFGGKYCVQCEPFKKNLERNLVQFKYIDVFENIKLANNWNVMSLPTTIAFKNGSAVGCLVGSQPINKIYKLLELCK